MKKSLSLTKHFGKLVTGLFGLLLLSTSAKSQSINCPDTVAVGTAVNFGINGNDKFYSYAWEFETNTFKPLLTNDAVAIPNTGTKGNSFDVSSEATMIYDNNTKSYYAFVTCASGGFVSPNVQRIDFGGDPHNPNPATSNLGNPGSAFITNSGGYHNIQDFKIVKDDNGIYHAFINNGGVIHWTFGNGLNNPPTQSVRIFTNPSVLGMSMNMAVVNYNYSWHIFTGQTFGASPGLVRLDIGADLNNIPSSVPYNIFQSPSGVYDIAMVAILKQNDNWYAYMTAQDGVTSLVKFSFGTNLLNNNPAITNYGAASTTGTFNRSLNFLKTCDTTLLVGLQQDGTVYSYDFMNNSVDNTPNPHNLGQKFGYPVAMQGFSPYWNRDTLWALTTSYANDANNTVFRFPIATISSGNTVMNYNIDAATHTFNTVGTYQVNVYCDQGDNKGPQSLCKQVVVVNTMPTSIANVANSALLNVYPNPLSGNKLNVTLPETGKVTYSISNTLGQAIFKHKENAVKGQTLSIDIPQNTITKGVYYLSFIYEDGTRYTSKLVKD